MCHPLHSLHYTLTGTVMGHTTPSTLAIRYCLFPCLTIQVATLAKLPTFTLQQQGSGLDILAAAAVASTKTPPALLAGLLHSTHNRATSTYNPAALLPQRVVKRILNLEFVEMSEITLDDQLPHEQGKPPPARPAIQDILQWLERYSLMTGKPASRFPDKAPELFAYQAIILSQSETTKRASGWRTIGCSVQLLWHRKTSTSLPPTPLSSTRPSRDGPRPSQGTSTACKMTILRRNVRETHTVRYWAGSRIPTPGRPTHQRRLQHITPTRPSSRSRRSCVGASTRANVKNRAKNADTPMHAVHVMAPMQQESAPEAVRHFPATAGHHHGSLLGFLPQWLHPLATMLAI